ncbi:MAG: hypothetical protein ACXADH_00010 [Candidatus Kariarchaeaceae archaeon]|jgi:hypothetical protein
MATITNLMNVVDDATATTNWVPANGGSAALNTDTFPPGASSSISDKVSNEVDGLLYNSGADAFTFVAGDHISIWYNALFGSLATRANGGVRVRIAGATESDYVDVYVGGSDTGKSGWNFVVVSLDAALENPDATGGTPPTTAGAVEHVGIVVNIQANVGGNNDNMAVGAIHRISAGSAAFRIEGDGGSAIVTWDDIATGIEADDGRGIVLKDSSGAFVLNGPLEFGSTTASSVDTNIQDTGVVLAWDNQEYVEPDFFGLTLNGNTTDTIQVNAGTKVGTGETAVGVNGWTIITGGPRWYIEAEDANQTAFNLYGCSFTGSSTWAIDDSTVEIISCVFSDCDTITMTGGASGPTILSNFFSQAPGPRAQVVFTSGVTPSDGQFDFNSFVNMDWFAIEVPSATTAFDLRGLSFAGNGTNRDILLSHTTGDIQLNVLEDGDSPQVTNGATITVTTVGTCDVIAVCAGTWKNALGTETNDLSAQGVPLVTQTTASLSADDDTFAIAAAVPGAKSDYTGGISTITYTGASDQYEDSNVASLPSAGGGIIARQGADEVTPSAATRTGFPVDALTETEGVQGIVHVDAAAGGTAVVNLDALTSGSRPQLRPWQTIENASSITFSYGAGNSDATKGDVDADRFVYVVVIALDGTAANTAVSSIVLNRSGGTTSFSGRTSAFPVQDDNVGTTGRSLELDVYDYDVDTGGQDLDQGTYDVNNAVNVVVSGVSEGTSVSVLATETDGVYTSGDVVGEGLADSSGTFTFSLNFAGFTDGLNVVVRCRNQGFPTAAIAATGGGVTFTDETTENNSSSTNDITLLPAVPTVSDAYYWGHSEEFNKLKLDISQAGGAGNALTWEYWNGSSWAGLTLGGSAVAPGNGDDTNNYQNTGPNVVSWDAPVGWATTSVNSQGPYYYVRARATAVGGAQPLGRKVKLDVTRYLPFTQDNTITSSGLNVLAVWIEDTISTF